MVTIVTEVAHRLRESSNRARSNVAATALAPARRASSGRLRLTTAMSDDDFPRWPPDWVEDHELAEEDTIAAEGDVSLASAVREDGQVLVSAAWPGGIRYLRVDPFGTADPQALRAGVKSEDPEVARTVEGVWSQALTLAKQLIDGDVRLPDPAPPSDDEGLGRRSWPRRD